MTSFKDYFKTTQNTDLTEKEKEVYGTQKNRLSDLDAEIDRVITSVAIMELELKAK